MNVRFGYTGYPAPTRPKDEVMVALPVPKLEEKMAALPANPITPELEEKMAAVQLKVLERVDDYLTNTEEQDLDSGTLKNLAVASGLTAGKSGLNFFA